MAVYQNPHLGMVPALRSHNHWAGPESIQREMSHYPRIRFAGKFVVLMQWQHCELRNQLKTSPVLWGKASSAQELAMMLQRKEGELLCEDVGGWGWGNEHQDNWEKKENEKKPRS